ncbi:hypothetical protein JRQ81_003162, partial [Phrynocephalus forsythii]
GKLAFHAMARGLPHPANEYWVQKMLESWTEERGLSKVDRAPIIPEILLKLNGLGF